MKQLACLSAILIATCISAPAAAQTVVPFNGIVSASCVITLGTSGILGVSTSSGTEIGSELTGGVPATLTIIATAGTPTISFSTPTMSQRPTAYTASPVISVKYSSLGGANQAYTSTNSSYTSTNVLGDTITLNMKAHDNSGFAAGSYRLQTTATCQQ